MLHFGAIPGRENAAQIRLHPIVGADDSTFRLHPFVRDARGQITTFDVPGAIGDTVALSINDHDEIAGTYYGPDSTSTNRDHGFLLKLRCTKTSD